MRDYYIAILHGSLLTVTVSLASLAVATLLGLAGAAAKLSGRRALVWTASFYTTVVPYQSQNQVYLDIKAGRIDGTVADKVEVHGGFLRKPEGQDFGYVGPDQYDQKYYGDGIGIAMRKGQSELQKQLNDAIATIRSNGTYDKIAKKYFDFDPYGK